MNNIKDIVENKNVKIEISVRNPEYKKYVNNLFTIVIESLIYSLFNNFDFNLNKEILNNFFKDMNECILIINKLKSQLNLFLFELPNLISFFEIQESLIENNKFNINNIKDYLILLNSENKEIKNKDFLSASKYLEEEYNFINYNLKEYKNFLDIVISLFSQKIMQVSDENYRQKILEIILKNNNLIINSKLIFRFYFLNLILIYL